MRAGVLLFGMALGVASIAAFSVNLAPGFASTRSTRHPHPFSSSTRHPPQHAFLRSTPRMSASESAASAKAGWRDGEFWEWRGMAVRYAVLNPAGEASPLLLVHGEH